MCLGIPGCVVGMVDGYGDQVALVDVEGATRRVNIGMLDDAPPPGQWVVIHMGFAVELTDAVGAETAMAGLELMGRARETRPAVDAGSTPDTGRTAAMGNGP